MNIVEIAHTMSALGAIAIILTGCVQLKGYLKRAAVK